MNKLLAVKVMIFGIIVGLLAAPAVAADDILIGNISGFTGTYSAMAKDVKDSVEMAIEEINNAGGLLGRKLQAIHEDDENAPAIGTRKMERLILERKVDFTMGAISSAATLAIMQVAQKYNKILMVPISQSDKITGESKNKVTFRTCANPGITSGALVNYMLNKLGKKVYLLTVDYAWGRSTSAVYNKLLKDSGANIVGETFFPLGNKDFAPYFGSVKTAKPDVLFITAAGNDALAVVVQAEQYGLKKLMKICGDGSLVAADVLPAMGLAANDIITADYYAASLNTPENKAWVAKYNKMYGRDPSKFSVSAYEGIMWLAQAIKAAGSVETNAVVKALEGSTYKGPQGLKKMDPSSHQTSLDVYMIRVEKGKAVIFDKAN
ncbi:MAG: ABC transporter substrate-binding protein [Pseudomonadota bacterium]